MSEALDILWRALLRTLGLTLLLWVVGLAYCPGWVQLGVIAATFGGMLVAEMGE